MRILFVTSEHPSCMFGGLGTFTREYVRELRKYCDVLCVYIHLGKGELPSPDETVDFVVRPEPVFDAFSPDAQILEIAGSIRSRLEELISAFRPDVIHCNDRHTYMPFRFDRNVFYSSHLIFTDLIKAHSLDDLYFQEVKIERCALSHSALVACYSNFAQKNIKNLAGVFSNPVVLPLGIRPELFYQKKRCDGKLRICYFGRFENSQKGVNDFIYAVNILGKKFKERNNIEYHLYGKGKLDSSLDLSLFCKLEFLTGSDLQEAYAKSDIVVMPSRYEPFGLTALEAMASGALLLTRAGLGMDMFAQKNRNCLELPFSVQDMAQTIRNAALDFEKYDFIRENAVRTAKEWTWTRSVKAHLYFYRLLSKNKTFEIQNAYRAEFWQLLKKYQEASDVEKLYIAEEERIAFSVVYDSLNEYEKNEEILVLTGTFVPENELFPENIHFVPVLEETEDGIFVRPECLPYKDSEFSKVIVAGAWESVLDLSASLIELQRVSSGSVDILYRTGRPLLWQTVKMEDEADWNAVSRSAWQSEKVYFPSLEILPEDYSYKLVRYTKSQQKNFDRPMLQTVLANEYA